MVRAHSSSGIAADTTPQHGGAPLHLLASKVSSARWATLPLAAAQSLSTKSGTCTKWGHESELGAAQLLGAA